MSEESWLEVKVWGDFACFTRPEMKAERVSYAVMTPSAARGTLEAVFWKPEFAWRVREIHVLKPIRFFSILRNEVNDKASMRPTGPYMADEPAHRAQRHTMALRDVAYVIHADIVLKPHAVGEHPAKYRDQFRRRVARGQCCFAPYLGCREFTASFAAPSGDEQPVEMTDDLGLMLFDLDYGVEEGRNVPRFFQARLDNGVLKVPPELYDVREVGHAAGKAG